MFLMSDQLLVYKYVSVLFSEPKIPQYPVARKKRWLEQCFSALQRAENSSMVLPALRRLLVEDVSVLFSEPKIPQSYLFVGTLILVVSFSALQRAENSSIDPSRRVAVPPARKFQCSSASRKFLNYPQRLPRDP